MVSNLSCIATYIWRREIVRHHSASFPGLSSSQLTRLSPQLLLLPVVGDGHPEATCDNAPANGGVEWVGASLPLFPETRTKGTNVDSKPTSLF